MRSRSASEILLRHLLQLATIHGAVALAGDAERSGHGEAGGFVVAGDHDRPDAGPLALGNGGAHFFARRVHLADEAEQSGLALELREARVVIDGKVLHLRDRQHAQRARAPWWRKRPLPPDAATRRAG